MNRSNHSIVAGEQLAVAAVPPILSGTHQAMTRHLTPPGKASRLTCERALVLAPHHDDEVLGCGGLLTQLVDEGGEIHVLYLSDSSGGEEGAEDPIAYTRIRRQESEQALIALGVTASTRHLELPDGSLANHMDQLVRAIRWALTERQPDLVLVPSPLEVSSDHRAAFAALHRALSPLRPDDDLFDKLQPCRFLAYEVNHPLYPDTLVDVGAQLEALRASLGMFKSQQQRHNYLEVGLGLKRFRVLTLGPEVEAAEGYRQLSLMDFTTRSAAQLITAMGGVPEVVQVTSAPTVSIVVRTLNRPKLLEQALESLAANRYGPLEVVVVNDGGSPVTWNPDRFPFDLVAINLEENRGRAGAAQVGVGTATGDYLGFLDDDDLLAPEHLSALTEAIQAEGVSVVYSDAAVGVYSLDPESGSQNHDWQLKGRHLPYSRDFDPDLLVVDNYIPCNTLLIDRKLLEAVGPFDESLSVMEDWDLLIRLAQLTSFRHLRQVTCEYRHFEGSGNSGVHDSSRLEKLDTHFLRAKALVLRKHAALLTPERLAKVVHTLSSEAAFARGRIDHLESVLAGNV